MGTELLETCTGFK